MESTAQTDTTITLAWNAVAGTGQYRIMVSPNSDMSGAAYWRFTPTTGTVKYLKADTTYYFKIRSLNTDGSNLTAYSTTYTTQTGPAAPPIPAAPTGLKTSVQTPTALGLTWTAMPNAIQYRVAIGTHADGSSASYYRYAVTTADIRGLTPGKIYYARVRIITADGSNISAYSPLVLVSTSPLPPRPAIASPLSVASYNLHCANCEDAMPTEVPWVDRRDDVIATISSKMPDIIGIQEASQGWLSTDSRPGGYSQFEDVRDRLNAAGAAYALTNDKRNNCENPQTPTGCVPVDQGASQGTRIFYNTEKTSIVRSGSKLLPSLDPEKNPRYMAWAEVIQLSTGKHFFFGDTHLEVDKDMGYNDLRRQQAETIVDVIKAQNTANLPVLMVGDMNSSKWLTPSNAPYDVFTGAGLIDPLGNTYGSSLPSGFATAEKVTNSNINSWNGFERHARASAPGTNGTYIDYIFTSKMRVPSWETVANIDASGDYVGQIPSDHDMIYATVGLP
ncbi:endonuclease/exonuclease/phosphatase family protein [Paenarthrobacter sp. Z7-10]|uniref:fibronectin type III domain-containing protein n=1 Tax=Paenarthrobacter sp. Z7-10 TaxID=2787635 RepID=UPI0022A9F286|nr:endonuclease/exonuclease/phosphatase family protein [Paenarthrobacter sp. Z7-10]MCZ2403444.1 endonuclease/exonuclease/phosphatase family protein [Paenarthrobacter sp. Z7-10]